MNEDVHYREEPRKEYPFPEMKAISAPEMAALLTTMILDNCLELLEIEQIMVRYKKRGGDNKP